MSVTPVCEFCRVNPGHLLCDGRLSDPAQVTHFRTCDKRVCRTCAGKPTQTMFLRMKGGCRTDTRDLCPDCRQAGRTA